MLLALIALAVASYQRADLPIDARVRDLVGRMTLEEKARQLDMYHGADLVDKKLDDTHAAPDARLDTAKYDKVLGAIGPGSIHDLYPGPALYNEIQKYVIEHNRLGIPALFIEEAVRGYQGKEQTTFPHSINLASTFDADLAKQTGAAIASEARAHGIGYLLCPVLDVARDPRWGRVEEDFGEDPYLSGVLGAAYVTGMQGNSLNTDHTAAAEPKHFAGHGAPEGGLNTSPVHAGERETRMVLLRSFQPAIEQAHARGVMAAYHEIDGVPCAGNPWLLTTVLRKEWGFQGFVLSDLGAIGELYYRHHVAATPADAARLAITSGVDMQFYDFSHEVFQKALVDGVKQHLMSRAALDAAVSHVLRVKFELGLFDRPYVDPELAPRVVRSPEHRELALRSARESMVLLRNEGNLLPLSASAKRIAVIGPNADVDRLGDYAIEPAQPYPSMLDGIKRHVAANTTVTFDDGKDIATAVAAAKGADVVIMGLGERSGISGEGSDRSDLNLPDNQEALLEAIQGTGVPTVLVMTNGRPLTIPWASTHIPAIIEAWYPGEAAGEAIAETLFGENNPAGRLPISFPRTVGAVPDFYNHDPSKDGRYVDGSMQPVYPFGFGLSYTSFSYSHAVATLDRSGQKPDVVVTADVTNTGSRDGDEVVQLYLRPETSSVEVPVRAMKAFARIHLQPGETRSVAFHLGRYELEIWGAAKEWTVEPGIYHAWIGGSSNAKLEATFSIKR
jgi:beta-glucosidase